jgi:hypothetical protein
MAVHLDSTQLSLVSLQHGGGRGKKQSHSQLGHFSFSHSKGSDIYLLVEAEEDWVRER